MEKGLKITTKGTTKKYVKLSLIAALIPLIIGNLIGLMGVALMVMQDESSPIAILCILFGFAGAMYGTYHGFTCLSYGKTYLEISDSHAEGVGIIGNSPNSFAISVKEIINITVNGTMISLHTTSGVYKIVTDVETAKKIIKFYQNKKYN